MNQVNFECQPDGRVVNPNLHDAEIVKVVLETHDGTRNAQLTLKTESEELFEVRCAGVAFANVAFFLPQNVILDFKVHWKKSVVKELASIEALDQFTFLNSSEVNERVLAGGLSILQIEPSVGAEVIVIAAKVEIYE